MAEGLRLVRSERGFRTLWLGGAITRLGDWLSYVAVSVLALHAGEGALALALVLAAHLLPHALTSLWSGSWVDRWDRRRILIVSTLVQGLLTWGMVAGALAGELLIVQILLLVRSGVGGIYLPAQTAALRTVVPRDALMAANTWMSTMWSVTFTLGVALGGVIAGIDPIIALILDAGTFGAAALVLRGLPSLRPSARDSGERKANVLQEMGVAVRLVLGRKELLRAIWAKVPIALAAGGAWIVLNLRADAAAAAGASALVLGALHAGRAVGCGIGPLVIEFLNGRGAPQDLLWKVAYAVAFVGMGLFTWSVTLPWLVLAAITWGIGSGGNYVIAATELQRHAPEGTMGRIAALDGLLSTSTMTFGACAGAALIDLGTPVGYAGLLGLGLGAVAWLAGHGLSRLAHTRRAPARGVCGENIPPTDGRYTTADPTQRPAGQVAAEAG